MMTDEAYPLPAEPGSDATMEIHERAIDVGSYTFVSESFMIADTVDPGLVREIRNAVPRYVPLLCRRLYKTPAGTVERHDYHVIGMYIPDPTASHQTDYVRIDWAPRGFPFDTKKIQAMRTLWAPWPKESFEFTISAPPAEVSFGPWVVESMKALKKAMDGVIAFDTKTGRTKQVTTTKDLLFEILNAEAKRDKELETKAMEEARYRMRHNWRWLKEAADKERLVPEPPDDASEPKTFDMHVKG